MVQYLGVARDPESGLLVLLMEMMDESLTAFLERSNEPLPYHLQVNLCHDVALALAYLHLNGIIHRDLSSNNVLLIAGSRAKVTDFGMSKLSEMHLRVTPLTQCPGTLAYMPPEALKVPPVYSKKLDIFSNGVVSVQIMTRNFPDPGPPTMEMEIQDPRFPSGTALVPVLEVDRRKNHIDLINPAHRLLPVALDCLKNREKERPSTQELCDCIAALKVEPQYSQSVQEGEREGGRGCSGAAEVLAAKDRDIQERDNRLQEKENRIQNLEEEVGVLGRQLQMAGVQVRQLQDKKFEELQEKDQELQRKDEELQQKDEVVREKNTQLQLQSQELYQKNQELDQKNHKLQEKDHELQQLWLQLASQDSPNPLRQTTHTSFTCSISGAGLETATVRVRSQISIEILYSQGGPCSSSQRVTAELNSTTSRSVTKAIVVQKSPSTYEVTYTPTTRGRHELCVRVNGDEIQGSPFSVVVYPDPTQLCQPVRVIEGVQRPYGAALNSHGEMYVTESSFSKVHAQVTVLDSSGRKISTFGSTGDIPGQFRWPFYIAVDESIYVTSGHKLQKFDRNGKFVKSVGSGRCGSKPGEFNDPRGIKVHQNRVYVCDLRNNRIQVFDLELMFITSFGTKGSGQGQYDEPNDLAFDSQGNIYVSERGNHRVQVLDHNSHYLRQFGDNSGPGKLNQPNGIHIAHECVYVSDYGNDRIAVFQLSGAFLTSFGKHGKGRGEFYRPCGITFDCDGLLCVCDWLNDRIQVF